MKKENPKIKIIREFKEYAYYNPLNVFKGLKKTGTNINIFGNQVAICISVCTISREKKQNSMKIGTYNAQELTNERKERLCKNRRFSSTVKTFVEEKKGLQWLV